MSKAKENGAPKAPAYDPNVTNVNTNSKMQDTVDVVLEGGRVVSIAKADYDETKHKLAKAKKAEDPPPPSK